MQDFCPIQDRKRICLSSSLFLPDFSVAYCLRTLLSFLPFLISALQGFTSGCIRFVLLESNRIENNGGTTTKYGIALHLYYRFYNFLDFYCALHPKNCFYQGLFVIIKEIFSKFKDNSKTNCTFLEFQEFSRTKVIFKDFSRSVRTLVTKDFAVKSNLLL